MSIYQDKKKEILLQITSNLSHSNLSLIQFISIFYRVEDFIKKEEINYLKKELYYSILRNKEKDFKKVIKLKNNQSFSTTFNLINYFNSIFQDDLVHISIVDQPKNSDGYFFRKNMFELEKLEKEHKK